MYSKINFSLEVMNQKIYCIQYLIIYLLVKLNRDKLKRHLKNEEHSLGVKE